MEHLNPETLARLVDEEPTEAEARHLGTCETCAAELTAFRVQVDALGRLPDLRPPRGDWEILEARLASEGLLATGGPVRRAALAPGWLKAAASVALFLVGTGVGAAVAGGGHRGASPAGGGGGPYTQAATLSFASVEEAAESVRQAERQYMDAWLRYRQMTEAEGGDALPDPATRIAALEYVVRAGQAALREAPADPFLNGLLASAVAEREAVIRRTSAASNENWY